MSCQYIYNIYYKLMHLIKQLYLIQCNTWDKVFKNAPSKICGRQPLKCEGVVYLTWAKPLQIF